MNSARILVVEDEGIIALSIQRKLEKMGYDVPVIASSGAEAIEEAAKSQPDLALMDIMLDGPMDGIEAATEIWHKFKIPVVYLTANSDAQTLERAKIAEPFAYLLKPFEDRELQTAIEIALYKHRMEKRLRESEQRLATTLNSIGEAVISTDNDGKITFINPVAEKLIGRAASNALDKPLSDVLHLISRGTGKRIEDAVSRVLQKGELVSLADDSLLIASDGAQIAVAGNAAPIKGDDGQPRGVVLALRNISERKEAEVAIHKAHEELQARSADLEQANKDLETLLYIISHDLKEPLRAIENFSNIVNRRYAARLDNKGQDFLHRVVRAAGRMRVLIDNLLKLSRIKRMTPPSNTVSSQRIVQEVLARLEERIKETGAIIIVSPDLPDFQVNRTWATEAIYNLVSNALKYGISADKNRENNRNEIEIEAYDGPKGIGIMVKDRGSGVAPEHAERIFELFQRAVGREIEGTGAGLAIVRQIAQRHGGHAWVQERDAPAGGSEFIITFGTGENN